MESDFLKQVMFDYWTSDPLFINAATVWWETLAMGNGEFGEWLWIHQILSS